MEFELVVVEQLNPVEIFSDGGVDKILKDIETKALSIVTDVSTPAGRRNIASLAFKVARSKTLLDDMGKVMVEDAKKKVKTMDADRKTIRDTLDALKERVRAPLTEWEVEEDKRRIAAEQQARERAQGFVDAFAGVGVSMPFMFAVELTDEDFFAKFTVAEDEYQKEQARIADEKRVEQERLAADKKAREEEAAKLAKERADLEKKEADMQAVLERMAADQRENEAILKAERDKIEADQRAIALSKLQHEQKLAIEKAALEAAERAVKDAAEKAQREATEKAEAERKAKEEAERQESLRPDKEKLIFYANKLTSFIAPLVESKEAESIIKEAEKRIVAVNRYIIKAAKEL